MVYVLVGAAGMIGALLRYYLGCETEGWGGGLFPYGTFLANMIGSFALSWLTAAATKKWDPKWVSAIGTGLIGSFTTFSTFSVETVQLISKGCFGIAILYVSLSLIGGLCMVGLGLRTARTFSEEGREEAN